MNENLRARNLLFLFLVLAFGLACEQPPPRERKQPPTAKENYNFHWSPQQQQPDPSVKLTIAVVKPNFDKESTIVEAGQLYRKFAKGFQRSMAVDMDKCLITKGIKVQGPHDTWDDMTYPDKQTADLAFTPQVFLTATIKYEPDGDVEGDYIQRPFNMNVQGHIAYELREPLSNQKLWIKKLELEPIDYRWVECYEAIPIWDAQGNFHGHSAGKLLYDGKQDAMANVMEKWYPTIMDKAWTYMNTDEMMNMKPQVEEIRKSKRY